MYIEPAKTTHLREILESSKRNVIVCHKTPDGDALGSSLCLAHTLIAMHKRATVIVPDMFPANLGFLPGAHNVVIASSNYELTATILAEADTIWCLDFNEPERLDRLAPYVMAVNARRILIDHHLNPAAFAELTFSYPEKSSTCAVLYSILKKAHLSEYVTAEGAACCCAGMMTDTGNFSYNSNDPDLYHILAELIDKGVNKDAIAKRMFDTSSERRLRIMGYCESRKMQIFKEHRCAVITLTTHEADEFDYHRGDTESLVNVPLSIPEVTWSVYLRATSPEQVKVSMRSKGDFSVREICANHFGGGGHLNAAGGEFFGTCDDALKAVVDIMPLYDYMLPSEGADNFPPIIIKHK